MLLSLSIQLKFSKQSSYDQRKNRKLILIPFIYLYLLLISFISGKCPAGQYNIFGHEPSCRLCPLHYYQPKEGAIDCIECDNDKITLSNGTDNSSDCLDAGKVYIQNLLEIFQTMKLIEFTLIFKYDSI